MSIKVPSTLDWLEKQRAWHVQEAKRIDRAIVAYKKEPISSAAPIKAKPDNSATTKTGISWTAEVTEILTSSEKPLRLSHVCKKLIQKGVVDTLSQSQKQIVYSVLARGARKGRFEKAGVGLYRIKPKIEKAARVRGGFFDEKEIGSPNSS